MEEQRGLKPSDLGKILRLLNDGLPQAPGLTARNIVAYGIVLKGMPVDVIQEAVYRVLSTWEKSSVLPTPGVIRRHALDVLAKREGLPTAEEAWMEIRQAVARYGVRGEPLDGGGYGPIRWSHPVVGQAVEAMGGAGYLSQNENTVADRAHWLRYIYPAALESWHRETGDRLALGLGANIPLLGKGDERDYGWPT